MNVGDHVSVNFISESRTEFSGINFSGNGIIDRIEDNRVFGRLYNGKPFMCDPMDVSVNLNIHDLDPYLNLLVELKLLSLQESQFIKNESCPDPNLSNMAEFGLYIFAHFQSVINDMAGQVAELEFQLLQETV
jgi:hypothetical protein